MEDKKFLEAVHDEAMRINIGLDGNKFEREPGFHASSAGSCHRLVLLRTLFPNLMRKRDQKSGQILSLGTRLHDMFDEFMKNYAQKNSRHLVIHTSTMVMMRENMSKAYARSMGVKVDELKKDAFTSVIGTGDMLIVDIDTKKLYFCDYKTANERSFAMKKKKGMSLTNALQLATYMHKDGGVIGLLGELFDVQNPELIYVNKSDLERFHVEVDLDIYIPLAEEYWNTAASHMARAFRTAGETIPDPVPSEPWMCQYCDAFRTQGECRTVNTIDELKELRKIEGSKKFRR